MRFVGVVIAVAMIAAVPGCSSATDASLPDDARITYRFQDSSVPPPYHRSYDLIVTRESSHIVVDSYGDVLADETVPTSADTWAALTEGYPAVAGARSTTSEPGCTGGTSSSLEVMSQGQTLVDVVEDECGDSPTADAIDTWIAPARELFPAMDELAPETEE